MSNDTKKNNQFKMAKLNNFDGQVSVLIKCVTDVLIIK